MSTQNADRDEEGKLKTRLKRYVDDHASITGNIMTLTKEHLHKRLLGRPVRFATVGADWVEEISPSGNWFRLRFNGWVEAQGFIVLEVLPSLCRLKGCGHTMDTSATSEDTTSYDKVANHAAPTPPDKRP